MTKARRLGVTTPVLYSVDPEVDDAVGKLDDGGLIHGDLTTSNIYVTQEWYQTACEFPFSSCFSFGRCNRRFPIFFILLSMTKSYYQPAYSRSISFCRS
jgi:hypothetical protein